jgi:hypothetical protein
MNFCGNEKILMNCRVLREEKNFYKIEFPEPNKILFLNAFLLKKNNSNTIELQKPTQLFFDKDLLLRNRIIPLTKD